MDRKRKKSLERRRRNAVRQDHEFQKLLMFTYQINPERRRKALLRVLKMLQELDGGE